MTTLMQASNQWATRPPEERFLSLTDLHTHMSLARRRSRSGVVSNRALTVAPAADSITGLSVCGPSGNAASPTHWAFSQLCTRAQAPAGFLRTLPSPMVADILNYQLKFKGDPEDTGILLRRDPETPDVNLLAVTGPRYGRVFNAEITQQLTSMFGDGVTGDWRVPGEFGKAVEVRKDNTTIYGSDRDMFVFLADETNRIEVPNRRDGQAGSMARGFFVWNSEVGAATLGIAFFLFDYVCCNRIVWGAQDYLEKRIRHTVSAPDRWLENVIPVIEDYSRSSAKPVQEAITNAQSRRLDDVTAFLAKRFTPTMVSAITSAHERDEGRPIETVWDAVTGATAYARDVPYQADRVAIERSAGDLLNS